MISPRIAYRARQFWNAILRPEFHIQTESTLPSLIPAELLLFRQMQPSEQAHAFQVYKQLVQGGHKQKDLLTAALLHDVGKILSPLSVFDRVVIVVGKYIFPKAARRWAEEPGRSWRRPFRVAAFHSEWGADLLEKAGASRLAIELVRRHHDPPIQNPVSKVELLLAKLQAVDNEN
jgi:hypothetical protein